MSYKSFLYFTKDPTPWSETAQWAKHSLYKLGDPDLTPGTHMMGEENKLEVVLTATGKLWDVSIFVGIHT